MNGFELNIYCDDEGLPWAAFVWGNINTKLVASMITPVAIEEATGFSDADLRGDEISWPPKVQAYWLRFNEDCETYSFCQEGDDGAERITLSREDVRAGHDLPRRCETDIVDGFGECIACDAISGERCQKPQKVTNLGQRGGDVGRHNRPIVRAWFITHPCGTNREAARALGLSEMAIGRHVKRIRAEWGG